MSQPALVSQDFASLIVLTGTGQPGFRITDSPGMIHVHFHFVPPRVDAAGRPIDNALARDDCGDSYVDPIAWCVTQRFALGRHSSCRTAGTNIVPGMGVHRAAHFSKVNYKHQETQPKLN